MHTKLSKSDSHLIRISACLAAGKFEHLRELITDAISTKVPGPSIYEILLQSYLILGYPKALEGLKILRSVCGDNISFSQVNYSFKYWPEWKIRGRVLCEKVYGKNFPKLIDRIDEISPELSEWMIVEGYGKVMARDTLPGFVRELCNVAALLVTSDVNQLHAHLRGAQNLGAGIGNVREALEIAGEFCSKPKRTIGKKLFEMIFEE